MRLLFVGLGIDCQLGGGADPIAIGLGRIISRLVRRGDGRVAPEIDGALVLRDFTRVLNLICQFSEATEHHIFMAVGVFWPITACPVFNTFRLLDGS